MAELDFKLPYSSFSELKKLLIAFAKSKSPSSLDDLNKLTSIPKTSISTNNGFLESIGIITGGKKKEATEEGKKLGLSLANNMEDESIKILHSFLVANHFLESMITALGIKPRTTEDFQSHIAYSLSKELKGYVKTGTGAVIEMMLFTNLVEEKDGLLSPTKASAAPVKSVPPKTKSDEQQIDSTSTIDTPSVTRKITNELGQNVTLNINIQLTIPDTDDEKVYENFFKAMKKHLL
jgi:hypothetical protein